MVHRVVTSVGHSSREQVPRSTVQIDLRRVVVRTGPHNVVGTFTTYNLLKPRWLKPPACGQVGLGFQEQHLTVLSSSRRGDPVAAETAVSQDQVQVRFVDAHTIRLTVPLAALGSDYTAAAPWIGFAGGYACPPLAQSEDDTGVVTPQA